MSCTKYIIMHSANSKCLICWMKRTICYIFHHFQIPWVIIIGHQHSRQSWQWFMITYSSISWSSGWMLVLLSKIATQISSDECNNYKNHSWSSYAYHYTIAQNCRRMYIGLDVLTVDAWFKIISKYLLALGKFVVDECLSVVVSTFSAIFVLHRVY